MPVAREGNSTSVVDGIIYVVGGTTGVPNVGTTRVDAYDPVTDTWTQKADMPTGRHTLASSALDGKVYVIGGATAQGAGSRAFSTVEEYTPEKRDISSVSPQGKLPTTWGAEKRYGDMETR
jgi:N-acetylneuraminic acid mutarotase